MLKDFKQLVKKEYPNAVVDISEDLDMLDMVNHIIAQEYEMSIEDIRESFLVSKDYPINKIAKVLLIQEFSEEYYQVKLDKYEIASINTIGDFLSLLEKKCDSKDT